MANDVNIFISDNPVYITISDGDTTQSVRVTPTAPAQNSISIEGDSLETVRVESSEFPPQTLNIETVNVSENIKYHSSFNWGFFLVFYIFIVAAILIGWYIYNEFKTKTKRFYFLL